MIFDSGCVWCPLGSLGSFEVGGALKFFHFCFCVANLDVLPVVFRSIIGFFKFPKKLCGPNVPQSSPQREGKLRSIILG